MLGGDRSPGTSSYSVAMTSRGAACTLGGESSPYTSSYSVFKAAPTAYPANTLGNKSSPYASSYSVVRAATTSAWRCLHSSGLNLWRA